MIFLMLSLGLMLGFFLYPCVIETEKSPQIVRRPVPELDENEVKAVLLAVQENVTDIEPFVHQIMEMKPKALPSSSPSSLLCKTRLSGDDASCNVKAVKRAIVSTNSGVRTKNLCTLHYDYYLNDKSVLSYEPIGEEN